MPKLTPEIIAQCREAAEKATARPWAWQKYQSRIVRIHAGIVATIAPNWLADEDGSFIALAANHLLDALDDLAEAQTEVKRLEAALRRIATEHQSYDDPAVLTFGDRSYQIGVVDGHRCAAEIARGCLAEYDSPTPPSADPLATEVERKAADPETRP